MNTPALVKEITTALPPGTPARYISSGTPLFAAYGCALLERRTAKSHVYSAVNLENGKTEILRRSVRPLDATAYPGMAAKIRASSVRGRGRNEIDLAPGERISQAKLAQVLAALFAEILPRYGYVVRENQIGLANHILDALRRRSISLAESEVGTGKTHAYLAASVLAKRGRLNDFWMRGHYPRQSYAESAHMPIVIATSSIALQRAIVTEYIPELSRILMEHDIIRTPLTCAVRKGKEHYLCEKRLHLFYQDADEQTKNLLRPLLEAGAPCDLAEANGLTQYMKKRICVQGKCGMDCPCYSDCGYAEYLAAANDPTVDFQVTNHNYFIADILHRRDGMRPLLPHYQMVIIDEAHKFLQAARQMYGLELTAEEISRLSQSIHSFTGEESDSGVNIHRLAKKLEVQSGLLFHRLAENAIHSGDEETDRFSAVIDEPARQHLKNISRIATKLTIAMENGCTAPRFRERKSQALWGLECLAKTAAGFQKRDRLICWIEDAGTLCDGVAKLCAVPKDLDALLHTDIWSNGIPFILTSGTLSAAGDFSRTRRSLGIDRMDKHLVMETSMPSPFDYRNNTLLYLSNAVPFPDYRNRAYLEGVADEVERLVRASHGHAAVLFTSYSAMGLVYAKLAKRGLPFPMFQMGRRDTAALEKFKASGNGILFAAGALWEGIDIPGDTLSMLIIVKLPFAAPDPIGAYEKTLYGGMGAYMAKVLRPDMLVKLKQGFGRLIRIETDTGVVAILDCRACMGAACHDTVLAALPPCRVTQRIDDVGDYIEEKKTPAYYTQRGLLSAA